jgi:NTE family protein
MSTTPSSPSYDATARIPKGERALVLGGGGSSGNAWSIGVLAGLLDAGLDVTTADLTIGTSAGSTTAAQVAGATPAEVFADVVSAGTPPRRGPADGGRGSRGHVTDHLERMRALIAAAEDLPDFRRTMGAMALAKDEESDGSEHARWRAIVAARLPSQHWPGRTLLITAVDAATGEPVVFDRHSGVDLVDAVAASCSSSFAYPIGDRRYVDGGYRANAENADLAAGHDRMLVLSPLGGGSLHPPEWGTQLAAQVAGLRAQGSRVETIVPAPSSEHMFGANAMDLSLRPAAARAGYDHGQAGAERIAQLWQ